MSTLERNIAGKPSSTQASTWFVLVVAVFITCLLTANIISVKLVSLWGLVVPAGVIIFPISYICGDVLTEVYGFRRARSVIWLGFFCNLLAVAGIVATQVLPGADFWMPRPPMSEFSVLHPASSRLRFART